MSSLFGFVYQIGARLLAARDFARLRRAPGVWGEPLEALQSAIDGLSAHIAILDSTGTILMVNAAWRAFATQNDFDSLTYGIGANYLTVCESASGVESPEAAVVAQGIHDILSLLRHSFQLEYAAHCPGGERWFRVRVTSFEIKAQVGAVVVHENITEHRNPQPPPPPPHHALQRPLTTPTAAPSPATPLHTE